MFNRCAVILSSCLLLLSCNNGKDVNQEEASAKTITPSQISFRLVDPSESGVDFENTIAEDFKLNYFSYGYMYNGGGVAAGDINNDGLTDLYFTSTTGKNSLYLNKGGFSFENISEAAGVSALKGLKTGVVMHDFNNDGYLDIFVCRSGNQKIKLRNNLLYINNGDLTFTESAEKYGLTDYSNSTQIALIDYDSDGDLDIYMVNHPAQFGTNNRPRVRPTPNGYERLTHPDAKNESDMLFRNNGNNSYTDVTASSGITNRAFGLSAVVSDFNRDGLADIFVGNDFIEPDFLYINQGNGKFKEEYDVYFRHISQNSMGADLADFNNDGLDDLVVLDMMPEDNQRQKSLMTTMAYNRYNTLLNFGYGHQVMRNVLQMQNQDGSFSEIGQLAGIAHTDWSWGPLFVDFDLDGLKDLFIANGFRRDIADLDFIKFKNDSINKGGGIPVSQMESIYDVLNKIPSVKLKNYMYKNNGSLKFEDVTDSWSLSEESFSNGAIHADLDNDGDPDLVINNLDSPAMIYENKRSNSNNWLKINCIGPAENLNGIGTRVRIKANGFSQYYSANPIRGFLSSTESQIICGLGIATYADTIEVFWPDGSYQLLTQMQVNNTIEVKHSEASARIKKTKSPTPVLSENSKLLNNPFTHIEDDFIDYKRDPLLPRLHSREGPALTVGDVDGDGLEDFFLGGAKGQSSVIHFQNRDGSFSLTVPEVFESDASFEDVDAIFFNANGDELPDLYVVSGGSHEAGNHPTYTDRLYINLGNRKFQRDDDFPEIKSSGGCVAGGDFDQDGDEDLFIGGRISAGRYPYAPNSFLLENDNGTFKDVSDQKAKLLKNIGMISDAAWADIDQDGKVELILAGEWMPIKIFTVGNDGKFKDVSKKFLPQESNGWWNCIEVQDYDSDGDLDILAGNYGWNSRFKASSLKPIEIYASDFDKNGKVDPIITYYIGDKSWPSAQKDLLVSQIPSIKKRYVKYGAYAKASVRDIFNAELDNALHLKCVTLSSTIFHNDGGNFRQIEMPVESQVSPVQDILCADINGDQKKEILLIGNDFYPETETARLDASNGCIFNISEAGDLEMIPLHKSGLNNPLDGRRLQIIHRSNLNPVIIIANNDGPVRIFELNPSSEWLF